MFLVGGMLHFLQKQMIILKVQQLSQPCLGNKTETVCTSSTADLCNIIGFFREASTVTDNHSSRWQQQTVCCMSLLKHLGWSGVCSASRKCSVPQKYPPGVHTWSKSSTFVIHAAVITIIFPSAPSKMGCLLRCSSYQLLFPPMGGCMPVKGEWWCWRCWWWGAGGWRGQKQRSVAGKGRLSMSRKTCGLLPKFILCKPKAANNIHQWRSAAGFMGVCTRSWM